MVGRDDVELGITITIIVSGWAFSGRSEQFFSQHSRIVEFHNLFSDVADVIMNKCLICTVY